MGNVTTEVVGANPTIDPNFWLPGNPGYSHIYRWGTLDNSDIGIRSSGCEKSGRTAYIIADVVGSIPTSVYQFYYSRCNL